MENRHTQTELAGAQERRSTKFEGNLARFTKIKTAHPFDPIIPL
jgi:hypothetical protein